LWGRPSVLYGKTDRAEGEGSVPRKEVSSKSAGGAVSVVLTV
jgi:hypothetical protein